MRLSLGKIDKYEYLTGKEILPSDQIQMLDQAKFSYSSLWTAFEKQTKTIGDHGSKQVEGLKPLNTDQQLNSIESSVPTTCLMLKLQMKISKLQNDDYKIEKYNITNKTK